MNADSTPSLEPIVSLFGEPLQVVNVGIAAFGEAVATAGGAGVSVVHVEWRPPGHGDPAVARALAKLVNRPEVELANAEAFRRYLEAQPVLEGIATAREVVPGLGDRTLLHSGPPIAWKDMCGPMQGAILGAIVLEGWAGDLAAARGLAESGGVAFAPNHQRQAVGPMAGVISPSMPVWIVRDRSHGNRAFCNLNEGLGKVLRLGAYGPEVLERLRWMSAVLAPALAAALARMGPLELKPLIAQALHMGDEVHNRNVAATALLLKRLVPALLAAGLSARTIEESVAFIAANDHFFLNVSMAACKATHGRGAKACPQQPRHGHGAQRRGVRRARQRRAAGAGSPRPRPSWTGCTSPATPGPMPRRTWATAPSPRRRAWAASPWRPRPRSCSSWAAPPRMPSPTRARWGTSRSDATRPGRCHPWISRERPPASTRARCWIRASRRSSTRASPIARRA